MEAGPDLLSFGADGHGGPCRDLGAEQQLVLELRQARKPAKAYGFVGVVISVKDLSASVWLWHKPNGQWAAKKVIEIPAEPAEPGGGLTLDPKFFLAAEEGYRTHQIRLDGGDSSPDTFCYP